MPPVFYILATIIAILIIYCIISVAYMKKRKQAYLNMQDKLRVGATALIGNGIYGRIVSLKPDVVELEIAPGVIIKADRASVFIPKITQNG